MDSNRDRNIDIDRDINMLNNRIQTCTLNVWN